MWTIHALVSDDDQSWPWIGISCPDSIQVEVPDLFVVWRICANSQAMTNQIQERLTDLRSGRTSVDDGDE